SLDNLKVFLDQFGYATPKQLLNSLKKWNRLVDKRFSSGEAIFAATGQDPDDVAPPLTEILGMAKDLGTSLDNVQKEYPDKFGPDFDDYDHFSPEATSDVVLQSTSLIFGPSAGRDILNFLEGRFTVTVTVMPSGAAPASLMPDTTKKLQLSKS